MKRQLLLEEFQKLQQKLRLAQTEEDAKRINQQIMMILDLLEEQDNEEEE